MKHFFFTLALCILLTGCSNGVAETEVTEPTPATVVTEQAAPASKIYPLPDTTMDHLRWRSGSQGSRSGHGSPRHRAERSERREGR